MKPIWSGDVALEAGRISDITLASNDGGNYIQLNAHLQFLSIVETARIPLHMTVGRPLHVQTDHVQTLAWFSNILLGSHGDQDTSDEGQWWQSARTDSPLGILVAVQDDSAQNSTLLRPRVTELLFFASRADASKSDRPPTPPQSSPFGPGFDENESKISVYALPLASGLLVKRIDEPTPPASPSIEDEKIEARFLPSAWDQPVHEPPVKKRKTVAETFDEAEERRRKARRKGGQGVAAAAALHNRPENTMPTLKHRRSVSNTQVPVQTRPLSRSSSVTSLRPISRREPSVPSIARPSALSHSQSVPVVPQLTEEALTEQKNKEFISKMVMAGMRMKGLKQSKSRRSRANSTTASPAVDATFDEIDADRKNDEEFKLVYHQAYKGACFAFRRQVDTIDLQMHIGAVDEAVTQLLDMFLKDPLSAEDNPVEDDRTPGGRKLFGSSAVRGAGDNNPFLQAAVMERDSKANTPCGRKDNISRELVT